MAWKLCQNDKESRAEGRGSTTYQCNQYSAFFDCFQAIIETEVLSPDENGDEKSHDNIFRWGDHLSHYEKSFYEMFGDEQSRRRSTAIYCATNPTHKIFQERF